LKQFHLKFEAKLFSVKTEIYNNKLNNKFQYNLRLYKNS